MLCASITQNTQGTYGIPVSTNLNLLSIRLLNTSTKRFADFNDSVPAYAILSHTWGADEVMFQHLQTSGYTEKPSWQKIERLCAQAAEDGFEFAWADTCCIDKTSSAELSETINSMFSFYKKSAKCYVYLADSKHFVPTIARDKRIQGAFEKTKQGLLIELKVLEVSSLSSTSPLVYGNSQLLGDN